MNAEVWELLSHAMLDTSSQVLGTPPKKANISGPGGFIPTRTEDSSKLVATSSQVSTWVAMPDNTKPIILPPEAVCAPTNPSTKTPWADMGALPVEVILLQEEMNNAMGHLLMTKASVDACWRKQVLGLEMAIHQNEAKATQAFREAKTHCGAAIREVEVHCAADLIATTCSI